MFRSLSKYTLIIFILWVLYGLIFTYLLSVIVYSNLLGVYKSQVLLIKVAIFRGDSK
jgi:hypothetical protein